MFTSTPTGTNNSFSIHYLKKHFDAVKHMSPMDFNSLMEEYAYENGLSLISLPKFKYEKKYAAKQLSIITTENGISHIHSTVQFSSGIWYEERSGTQRLKYSWVCYLHCQLLGV